MHASLINHYILGASYPRGGASELVIHMIPVIEKAGGRVFVRAPVTQILTENGKAVGMHHHHSINVTPLPTKLFNSIFHPPNPLTAKLFNQNFHPLEVVSR